VESLLPLFAHPGSAPDTWASVARAGAGVLAVLDVAGGPGTGRDPGWTAAVSRLAGAGVTTLGYVDLSFGVRPVREVRADVRRWAGYPVAGVYFDRAPGSPFLIGPVATAVAAAQRCGLPRILLNHGVVPDALYRTLGAQLCVFEGDWAALRDAPPTGALVGDGYLVHGVPAAELALVETVLHARGAGFALVTDRCAPDPYGRLPSWLDLAAAR